MTFRKEGSAPGQGRGRRLDAATRRAEIVEAAAAVFEGRDPHDVTFEEVAGAAGVSRALVYNYFRDKGELVAEVYLRSLRRLDAALAASLGELAGDRELRVEERLPVVVHTYLRFAEADPEAFRNLVDTETVHHPKVRDARRDRLEALASSWGASPEAHVVAAAVVGLLEAGTVGWLEEQELGVDLNRVADLLVGVLQRGVPSTLRSE
ncbi:MAG: TetR/AcrR family transcriptional regulator [Actinobacteria bacterium]|nr:TetR/AcrR family transcriptional regulator [Actinomycetota bacterium]